MDVNCGYIHRGIEKLCESLTYPQTLALTDRLDYLAAHQNRHALCMCIEEAMGLEIPERVKYIRTIMDELNRLSSHLLFWSCLCAGYGSADRFLLRLPRPGESAGHHGRNHGRTTDSELQRHRRRDGGHPPEPNQPDQRVHQIPTPR